MSRPGRIDSYRPFARALHWATALIVLATIPAGLIMVQSGLDRSLQNALFMFHKNIGVVVLGLMVLRLVYRAANPPPPLPASMPAAQRSIAGLVHGLLYLTVIIMAVSGYIRVVAGGFPLEAFDALGVPRLLAKSEAIANTAKTVHFVTHYVVMALIALHIAAALYHAIIKRDGVFARMWPALGR